MSNHSIFQGLQKRLKLSRRSFLKTTATGAGIVAAGGLTESK